MCIDCSINIANLYSYAVIFISMLNSSIGRWFSLEWPGWRHAKLELFQIIAGSKGGNYDTSDHAHIISQKIENSIHNTSVLHCSYF